MSAEWLVPEGEPEQLARYVIPKMYAGTWLLPRDAGELRKKPFLFAQRIYENLCQESIRYDIEAWSPEGRPIRQPWHVLREQKVANCLELSLIYAGLCLAAHLRPLIVTFTPRVGPRHALVLLTGWLSNNDVIKLWDELPGANGWCCVTWRQLRRPIDNGLLRPLELTRLTSTAATGPADFETARADGVTKLTDATDIVVLDVHRLQSKPLNRVRARDEYIPLRTNLRENPHFFSAAIVSKYATLLGDPPPPWDLRTLRGMRLADEAESTRLALVRALEAKPVFEAVNGTRPSAHRLKGIYRRNVQRDPASGLDEMMLAEAADVDDGEYPDALVRFVLAVAAENGRTDHPALIRWLRHERVQDEDIDEIVLANQPAGAAGRTRHWAIVHLDHHETFGLHPGGWDVRIEVLPWLGSGRSFRAHCRREDELTAALISLFRELTSSIRLGDSFVVDIVAPRPLLDKRLEHWELVGADDGGDPQPLSPHYKPRLRWDRHFYGDKQGMQADREEHVDWRLKPELVPAKKAKDAKALNAWLAEKLVKARPVLIAGGGNGRGDPLLTILRAGQGRVLWYPDGIQHWQAWRIRQRWNGTSSEAPDLPETLVSGLVFPNVPVVIWNDLKGREGQRLPMARPESLPEMEAS
jgi:hypothetical protein